ncbi:MAG: CDP-glucose 4,6-dehydratase [Deltaproteobacteria bacterium]|nr:CDP-glucose 4,6-dehydratase [Deltaproteobacteria bacterium]
MNAAFWRGRSVLVTGHTGFKGSWLALWLQQLGARVTGYALAPPTEPSLFAQARVADGMTSIMADVRDLGRLTDSVGSAAPEIVLHLAAQSLVRASYEQPVDTYATNVMGTVHLLEAARQVPSVRAVVIVTTDKCYENREWLWGYRERDRLGGRDPYSNSKACAELVTDAYRQSFFSEHGAAVASARAGNVVGGGDWAKDRVVPDAMRAFLTGQPLTVRNPRSTRPWQHVLEPLAGYLTLAERLVTEGRSFAEAWNFGPPDELVLPVGELVTKLAAAWGPGATWSTPGAPTGPHEATLLRLDISKARTQLGWTPRLSIDTTLAWIAEWHQTVGRGGDARAITEQQIASYAAMGL